jgi:hypothetical protein
MRHENHDDDDGDDAIGRHDDGNETLNARSRATEAMFAGLAPALGGVDPVAAGFAAGRRSGQAAARRQLFAWRAAAAVALVGMGLSWIVPLSSTTSPSTPSTHNDRIAEHSSPPPMMASMGSPTATPVLPAESILAIQQAVAKEGLAGLPSPRLPARSRSVRDADLF